MTEGIRDGRLRARMRSVWRRSQVLHGSAGLLAWCRWVLLLFLLGMALDWLVGLPPAGRGVILAAVGIVASRAAWQLGWRHLRRFDAARTALQVERSQGGMESLLVTAVQFDSAGATPGVSAALCAETRRRAESAAEAIRPEQTVSFGGLRRGLLFALIPVSIIGGFALLHGSFLAAGFGRIFAPWLAIEYPTRTRIALAAGDRIVKEGSGLRLVAKLSGEIPDAAQIILRTGSGEPRTRALAVTGGVCAYEAETIFRSFDYRIAAGDARSAWHRVRVVAAPRFERARLRLEFPEYTRRPAQTVEALTLTVPEGTRIRWQLALDRSVSQAEFCPVEGTPRAMVVSSDGRQVTMEQTAAASRAYSFRWVDAEHGFRFSSPRYYLQVAPDRAPSVEFTSPDRMLFATLRRRLDFAYRGRDDHGIGAAAITYRVNKTAEKRVALPPPEAGADGPQRIDWNYREALPDLAVGDTVTFAIELADRYPGPGGPHRARSEARRVRFLSPADYLAQIEKQRRRLLVRIRTIYREERRVHDLLRHLDPAADPFAQTCQLEAVRQDLLRERVAAIGHRIAELIDDIAANDLAEDPALAALAAELQRIGETRLGRAATLLRALAAVDGAGSPREPAAAIDMIHSSARELGLVVLQLGFAEAADVMARELHATAQTQAALRLDTILASPAGREKRAAAQIRLAEETTRLLAATPRNRESTSGDAIVAFQLSRLVNELLRSGVDAKMRSAVALAAGGDPDAAARVQAEVIAALLRAEFRLRLGAEYEALTQARDLFVAQTAEQRRLREESVGQTPAEFRSDRPRLAASQGSLQRQLRLLLMPEVPAPWPRLFDAGAPQPPPVADLLVRADRAMEAASRQIRAGDSAGAAEQQRAAENSFSSLARIVRERIEAVTKVARTEATVTALAKLAAQRLMLEERLLALLEQTEDTAADEAPTAPLASTNQALAEDATGFRRTLTLWNQSLPTPDPGTLPLLGHLAEAAQAIRAATPHLAANRAGAARQLQERALQELEAAGALIEARSRTLTALAVVLATTRDALTPSPLLLEIEAEQSQLTAVAKTARPADLKTLVIPQKNLIQAVNAVLTALDPLAHKIESGTVMLFAKEDMNAAATGLETGDLTDALDAQAFVVETLQELRGKIDQVTPSFRYVREITECLAEVIPRSAALRTGLRQLREGTEGAAKAAAVKGEAERFGRDLTRLTGAPRYAATASRLAAASASSGSEPELGPVLEQLAADTAQLQTLIENLAYLITPPPSGSFVEPPSPEVKLIHQALPIAAHHQDLVRRTLATASARTADLAGTQRELATRAAALLPASGGGHPHLVAAHRHLSEAAANLQSGDRKAAIPQQRQAADALRFFLLEFVLKHIAVPPPPPPQDSAPSDDAVPEDSELQLFLPGALTGTRPKGGRLEWQVLGRRDRAALNENFARELPLEYRAILKDYYERLTK